MEQSLIEISEIERKLTRAGGRFELVDVEMVGYVGKAFRHAPHSIQEIFGKARAADTSLFVITSQGRFSYADVLDRASCLSEALSRKCHIEHGARVVLALENGVDWIVTLIAIMSLGGTPVLTTPELLDSVLKTPALNPSAVVRMQSEITVLADGNPGTPIVDILSSSPKTSMPLGDFLASGVKRPDHSFRGQPDDEAIIVFTSGSSGPPKGVVLTHRALGNGLMNTLFATMLAGSGASRARTARHQARSPSRPLILSHLSHISGLSQLLHAMMLGRPLIFPSNRSLESAITMLHKEGATSIVGLAPAAMQSLITATALSRESTLQAINLSGANLDVKVLNAIAARLPQAMISTSYGMTETCGAICAIAGEELQSRPESSGQLVPTAEVEIRHPDGGVCCAEQTGKIWLRGPMLMHGYLGFTDLMSRDDWFATGDVGYLSQDHHLHLVGREDLLVNGAPISSLLLERLAMEDVAITDAVALQDPEIDDAAVLLFTAQTDVTVDEYSLCKRILLRFGSLRSLRVVRRTQFLLTSSGKIDRHALRTELHHCHSVVASNSGD